MAFPAIFLDICGRGPCPLARRPSKGPARLSRALRLQREYRVLAAEESVLGHAECAHDGLRRIQRPNRGTLRPVLDPTFKAGANSPWGLLFRLVARGPRVAGLHNTDALGPDKQPGQDPRETLAKLALPWRYQRVTAASHGSENGPRFPPVAPRAGRRWRFGEILMEIRLIIGTDRLFLLNGRRNGPLRRGAAAGCPWAPVLFAMAGGTERRCAAEVGLRGKGQLRRLISTP